MKLFFFGVQSLYKYDRNGRLECGSCGSKKFKVVAELTISDVSKADEDPIANRTVDAENIISIICERCGRPVNND